MAKELKKKEYAEHLRPLQVELAQMHRWLQAKGQRLVVLFEGRDTAGKGGAINCFTQVLNPRYCRVAALPKPSERERTQWYFQRYITHLPSAGEIVLFDRSWYNRAGVEKVMGFCTDAQYKAFLRDVVTFERLLVADGILLFKYWFSVDQSQQEARFAERIEDPIKRFKISPMDLESRSRYADYTRAAEAMFRHTHIKEAPWHVVDANDQKRARLNMIRHLLDALPDHDVPPEPIKFPPLASRPARHRVKAKVVHVPERY
ncbi:MAG: polyphosphate kinase 2 [Xanthomonadaceae bacterium]|jgi:polyphosphate kinase 2|nr:polyphosphate kinase 2 [Xanthomonadaceae bacterium]